MGQREVYDKFGNLISGGYQNTEIWYGKRKLFLSKRIQVMILKWVNVR